MANPSLIQLLIFSLPFLGNAVSSSMPPKYPIEIPINDQQGEDGATGHNNVPSASLSSPSSSSSSNEYPIEIPIVGNAPARAMPKCTIRHYSADSFVCVCNGTFCDQPEDVGPLGGQNAVMYISDPVQHRLDRSEVPMERKGKGRVESKPNKVHIRVDPSKRFQSILGFGGAFTDAAGYNMNLLSADARLQLLRAYFDKTTGIRYTLGRVPIASCDFSTRVYSYCDTPGDFELKTFALAKEDLKMKIPHIRKAMELSESGIKLFGSPWSAPGWLKTTGKMQGGGSLKGKLDGPYYRTYANYFLRFFEEYARLGNITFWGLTIENEPYEGLDIGYLFQAMWISPEMQRDFANQLLGPALKNSSIAKNIHIMAHDHNLDNIVDAAQKIFSIKSPASSMNSSIAGLAYHWYAGYTNPDKSAISRLHQLYPDRFVLGTEACSGWVGSDRGPALGNWTRAQMYARDILRSMNNWAIGWTDWNLCLDQRGGPNWVNNFVDSPIIVNPSKDEFYKQPMFYAMAHFSRFVPPDSVRIDSVQLAASFSPSSSPSSSPSFPPIEFVAFRTKVGDRVLVLLSNLDQPMEVAVEEGGRMARVTVPPRAFASVIWSKGAK